MAYSASRLSGKNLKEVVMSQQIQFSFQIRQAMQVACAVAEEVVNNTYHGHPFGKRWEQEIRPVLLSIRGTVPTFHFEGGVVVKVYMVDMRNFTDYHQDWVVTHTEVRYLPCDPYSNPVQKKISEVWEAEKLLALKKIRRWHHPLVLDKNEIKGTVGVFVDNVASDGYIEVNPNSNQEGHYKLRDEVEYRRFVDGDLQRAQKEAQEKLDEILAYL